MVHGCSDCPLMTHVSYDGDGCRIDYYLATFLKTAKEVED